MDATILPVEVLVCSGDESLADLLSLNLARRGIGAQTIAWSACCGQLQDQLPDAGMVVVDLDCPEPDCWGGATRARAAFEHTPLILLTHGWPELRRLRELQPCAHLAKPFAIEKLLQLVKELQPAG